MQWFILYMTNILFTTKIFYIKIKLYDFFFYRRCLNTHAFIMYLSFWFLFKSVPHQLLIIIYTHFLYFYLLFICSLFTASVHSFWGILNHTAFRFFSKVSLCHVRNINKWNYLAVIISNVCYLCTKLDKEIFFIYKIFVIKLSK